MRVGGADAGHPKGHNEGVNKALVIKKEVWKAD